MGSHIIEQLSSVQWPGASLVTDVHLEWPFGQSLSVWQLFLSCTSFSSLTSNAMTVAAIAPITITFIRIFSILL